ncbi:MAG: hypothetical protein WBK33_02020, partial [Limnochordia bacterium]
MLHWSRRLVVVLVLAIACSVGLGPVASGQNLTVSQWVSLLGSSNQQAFDYFVSLGPDAVPILMNAIDT